MDNYNKFIGIHSSAPTIGSLLGVRLGYNALINIKELMRQFYEAYEKEGFMLLKRHGRLSGALREFMAAVD